MGRSLPIASEREKRIFDILADGLNWGFGPDLPTLDELKAIARKIAAIDEDDDPGGSHRVLADGSVYRFEDDRWVFCGPRAGVCEGCGEVMDPRDEPDPPSWCPLCGGDLRLPS